MPPAASICIMSEVPDRDSPETIVIIRTFPANIDRQDYTHPRLSCIVRRIADRPLRRVHRSATLRNCW
jgi:hypothetical protein